MTELLVKSDPIESTLIAHKCPYCSNVVRYFDDECSICLQKIPESFWAFAHQTAFEIIESEYIDSISSSEEKYIESQQNALDDLHEWKIVTALENLYGNQSNINLCCGLHFSECLCEVKIDFDSAINNEKFNVDAAYVDKECEHCAMWFTPYCGALIAYIHDSIDNIDPIPVRVCNEFATEEEIEKFAETNYDNYFDVQ